MTLDRLTVEISADTNQAKQKIEQLKRQLVGAVDEIDKLKALLKKMEASGVSKTSKEFQDLTSRIEEAENAAIDLLDEIDLLEGKSSDLKTAGENIGDGFEKGSSKASSSLGSIISKASILAFAIKEAKEALEDFVSENEDSYISKAITEAKESWHDLKEDAVNSFGPLIVQIADLFSTINRQVKPVNEMISQIVMILDKTKILDVLKGASYIINELVHGPIKLLNIGLQEISGSVTRINLELNDIEILYKDLTQYQTSYNKELKKTLSLISGFDELNVLSKSNQSTNDESNQEEINELNEYFLYLKLKQKEVQDEINNIYKQYADLLGISVDSYKELVGYYNNGQIDAFEKKCEALGIDFSSANSSMKNFKADAEPIINQLTDEYSKLGDEIARVASLINSLGGSTTKSYGTMLSEAAERRWQENEEGNAENYSASFDKKAEELREKKLASYFGMAFGKRVMPFAKGGVLTTPTIGLMGEYAGASSNPEIVAPQSVIYDTVVSANGQLASVMAQVGQQIVSAVNNQNMEVKIGDDVIAQSAYRGNKAYYNRTGSYLI